MRVKAKHKIPRQAAKRFMQEESIFKTPASTLKKADLKAKMRVRHCLLKHRGRTAQIRRRRPRPLAQALGGVTGCRLCKI